MDNERPTEQKTEDLGAAVRRVDRHRAMLAELVSAQVRALLELKDVRRKAGGLSTVEPSLAEIERDLRRADRFRRLIEEEMSGPKRGLPKVLLIDDDTTTRNLISHFLRKENIVVEKAGDGSDGLARARNGRPDLIVLDAVVPGLDGFEVLQRLRKDPETAVIPVLILSSLDEEDAIVKSLEEGADYIIKPFSPRVLVAKIKKILKECAADAVDRRPL